MLTNEIIKQVPKVELHSHLDGSLLPETVIDLARKQGVKLPSEDPVELKDYFIRGCKRKSLALYLETFEYTVGVMQTAEALERVAYEDLRSLAQENVVYAEIRFAPILHTEKGLTLDEIVTRVLSGMEAAKKQFGISFGLILCAMRHQDPQLSLKIAELSVAFRDRGVVGFDLAGDENGYPPKDHIEAFRYIRSQNFNITIHAGEAFGIESIWQAIQICGAQRIGHGTRLIEDMSYSGQKIESYGTLSRFVLDKRIPLEMCLTSNVGTGACKDYASHPFNLFYRNNFRVFLCCDNRLMSDTSMTKEMRLAVDNYGLDLRDLEKITINAMKSSFMHQEEKLSIIYDKIKKGYLDIRTKYTSY